MSSTEQRSHQLSRPFTPRVDMGTTPCGCGQELDQVAGGHCPRCGTQLGAPHVEPVGFWQAA